MTTLTLSLGILTLVATQDGPYVRATVSGPTGALGQLHFTIPEWSSLAAVADVLAAAERRHAEDAAEIKAFRQSLMHACELRQATNDNERQLWAMRQTADRLSERFSHERVQAKYAEYASDESPLHVARAEIDVLRQECRELTAQRDAACSALALRERMEGEQ